MPLFMAISGYFSFFALQRLSWLGGLRRRFRQIALPIVAWSTIWSIGMFFFCLAVIPAANLSWAARIPADILDHSLFSFWFLTAVLGATFLVLTLRACKLDHAWGLLACALLLMAVPEYINFPLYKYVFPFFCVGYWLARAGFAVTASTRNILAWTLPAALGLYLWTDLTYVYSSGSALTRDNLFNLAVRYCTGFAMSAAIVLLFKRLFATVTPLTALTRWGRRSLEIYMIQALFFGLLANRLQFLDRPWAAFALLPAAWLLNESFAFIGHLLERHRFTAALFLGRFQPPAQPAPLQTQTE